MVPETTRVHSAVSADRTITTPTVYSFSGNLSERKIPSLDGMRAVAVILVILHHLNVPFIPEGRGVLTFFVMSGFLITWLMLKESEKRGEVSIQNFYVRRALRILPAFYVFWALYVALLLAMKGRPSASEMADCLSAFFYVSNYRRALVPGTHMVHTWALSLEEQFYLFWPWLFVAFQYDLRKLTRVLIALIATVDIYRGILFFSFHAPENWLKFTFDCRIDHLLVGCLLAVLLERGVLQEFWNFVTARVCYSLVPLGLIIASISLDFRYHLPYRIAIGYVIDPLLTAILLVQVVAFGNSFWWGWLNARFVRYVGRVSYSMFLFHVFTNGLVQRAIGHQSKLIVAPVAIGLAILLGSISHYAVELKFLRLKSRFVPTTATEKLTVLSTIPLQKPVEV
jgi:peptidoglycan/LPS O-acetylase OafA/YrhL